MTPLLFSEIDAYARLMQVSITPWEVELLRICDRVAIRTISKKRPQTTTDPQGRKFENKGNLDQAPTLAAFSGARVLKS